MEEGLLYIDYRMIMCVCVLFNATHILHPSVVWKRAPKTDCNIVQVITRQFTLIMI